MWIGRLLFLEDLSQVPQCWCRAQQVRFCSNPLQSQFAWPRHRGNQYSILKLEAVYTQCVFLRRAYDHYYQLQ
ncbi:Uncharacterized protein HZ326_22088 [Fusarium oxysporum f. sp. albedinis]|nr:Uncharacterized protein HZ326_23701 [Fusarium oxysporum f. sp. albedinis]KAJ0134854.1 Uncharacterized protein HZ326_22088 [Fusarium oxysporum f. sp. albedinis]